MASNFFKDNRKIVSPHDVVPDMASFSNGYERGYLVAREKFSMIKCANCNHYIDSECKRLGIKEGASFGCAYFDMKAGVIYDKSKIKQEGESDICASEGCGCVNKGDSK